MSLENPAPVQLQKLSERHKQVAALLAQGVPRQVIAEIVQYTPEYITWLQRQELFAEYVKEMTAAASVRLEALFDKSVEVIAENLNAGGEIGLKAARLQLEATGRVGREKAPAGPSETSEERLEALAQRLVRLLHAKRATDIVDVTPLGDQQHASS